MKRILISLFILIHLFIITLCIFLFVSLNKATNVINLTEYILKYQTNPISCYVEYSDVIDNKIEITIVIVNNANDEFSIDIDYDNLEDAVMLKVDDVLIGIDSKTSKHNFLLKQGIIASKKYVVDVKDKEEISVNIYMPLTNIRSRINGNVRIIDDFISVIDNYIINS